LRTTPGQDCGGLECARPLNYNIINVAPCPILTLDPITVNAVTWAYTNTVNPPGTYTIRIYLASDNSLVLSQGGAIPAIGALVTNTFNGLFCETEYWVQATITLNTVDTVCPPITVITLDCPCVAPSDVDATSVIP
jgi:hypothetical protein